MTGAMGFKKFGDVIRLTRTGEGGDKARSLKAEYFSPKQRQAVEQVRNLQEAWGAQEYLLVKI